MQSILVVDRNSVDSATKIQSSAPLCISFAKWIKKKEHHKGLNTKNFLMRWKLITRCYNEPGRTENVRDLAKSLKSLDICYRRCKFIKTTQ